jgi:hypothetical protein
VISMSSELVEVGSYLAKELNRGFFISSMEVEAPKVTPMSRARVMKSRIRK